MRLRKNVSMTGLVVLLQRDLVTRLIASPKTTTTF
jgi:hypothetical protein